MSKSPYALTIICTYEAILFTEEVQSYSREKKLEEKGLPKKYWTGLSFWGDINAQKFPNAYKWCPDSTQFVVERFASGWFVTRVGRMHCSEKKVTLASALNDEQKQGDCGKLQEVLKETANEKSNPINPVCCRIHHRSIVSLACYAGLLDHLARHARYSSSTSTPGRRRSGKKAQLLAVGNFIIDQYLEDPDDYSLYSFKAVEDWFDDCILGEEDGLYRVIDNCAYGDFDMRLVADSINDLIKHGILKVVYNGGFKIGYID